MHAITRVVTVPIKVMAPVVRPAVLRKPVLRQEGELFTVGFRSARHGFFALGYGKTAKEAFHMYVACNGPQLFKEWDDLSWSTVSFRHPGIGSVPVPDHV